MEKEAFMSLSEGWVFIVNPVAGNGYGAGCAGIIKEMLKRHGVSGEIVLTRAKGHATELAASFAEKGFPRIIGVGGDGTMNEVAQALVGREEVVFGAVAAGTGNDFIHILGFPDRFGDGEWQALFDAKAARMDVGRCNGKYFFNGMGLGFDAQVAFENYSVDDGGAVRSGSKSKYFWHILKTIYLYKEKDMRLTLNGVTENRKCFLNTIANGRRLAGGFTLTPKAMADDGLLDLCLADPLSLPMRLRELAAVMNGTHLKDSVFHYYQVPGLTVEFDTEVPAHLDGELIFDSRFQIDVVAKGLRVIINPRGEHYFLRPAP
jgi:diacylglycerol kinase (ATP)